MLDSPNFKRWCNQHLLAFPKISKGEVPTMATLTQNLLVRPFKAVVGRNGLMERYFYFSMSLLVAAIVVWGFSHSINDNLFHPAVPRPFIL